MRPVPAAQPHLRLGPLFSEGRDVEVVAGALASCMHRMWRGPLIRYLAYRSRHR